MTRPLVLRSRAASYSRRQPICRVLSATSRPLLAIGPEAAEALLHFVDEWDASTSEGDRLRTAEAFARSERSIAAQPGEHVNERNRKTRRIRWNIRGRARR